eukprot:54213-Amphidinium_carterae.1
MPTGEVNLETPPFYFGGDSDSPQQTCAIRALSTSLTTTAYAPSGSPPSPARSPHALLAFVCGVFPCLVCEGLRGANKFAAHVLIRWCRVAM